MPEWGIVAALILAGTTIPIVYYGGRTKQFELLPRPKESLYEKILNKLTRSYSR